MLIKFTDRELDIMAVLWERGSATVSEVRAALDHPFAYNTVLTVLRVLEEKGYVTHVAEGKAHRYVPAVEPDVAGRSALTRILHTMFAGSPALLLTQLVERPARSIAATAALARRAHARLAARGGRDAK